MIATKNHKITTILVVIALAGLLIVSTSAIGSGHTAFANEKRKGTGGGGWGNDGGGGGPPGGGPPGGGPPGGSDGGNGDSVSVDGSNTGINVQTDTNQKQDCLTAGASSGITNSCTASSTDTVTQSGGILKK